jgi:hypothetical protein
MCTPRTGEIDILRRLPNLARMASVHGLCAALMSPKRCKRGAPRLGRSRPYDPHHVIEISAIILSRSPIGHVPMEEVALRSPGCVYDGSWSGRNDSFADHPDRSASGKERSSGETAPSACRARTTGCGRKRHRPIVDFQTGWCLVWKCGACRCRVLLDEASSRRFCSPYGWISSYRPA